MDLFINDNKVEFKLDSEKTLGDFLLGVQKDCEQNNATIVFLNVDGKHIETAEEIDKIEKLDITSIKELRLSTVSKEDIKETFHSLEGAIPAISESLEQVSVFLQTGKDSKAFEAVKEFTMFFDTFCRVVKISSLFQEDFINYKIGGKTISDFLTDFTPILNDFEAALDNKDTVQIGDLCEYEILPIVQDIEIFCKGII